MISTPQLPLLAGDRIMSESADQSRRAALKQIIMGVTLAPFAIDSATALAADEPLLSENDPAAKELQYVADAGRAKDAKPGQTCATCSVFDGASGAAQGHCTLFAGKLVKTAGWCAAWTNL
jgi:hypothetical protein